MTKRYDVVIIGGGPSGSACAYWLSQAGHDVLLVEKKVFPREKTCGDGLTPRSVRQLEDMGLGGVLSQYHRVDGLRCIGFGKTQTVHWPDHPTLPGYGYVVTRHDLDQLVAETAEKAGAEVWQGAEALEPIFEDGFVRGARIRKKGNDELVTARAKYVVVADGANSRFGRALGTSRDKSYPLGMAIRGYFTSPHHGDHIMESHLDLRDRDGNVLPGYGWIFPVGDGRINVGVGLLSTFNKWKNVNTTHLMDAFVQTAPSHWGISPDTACAPATGGRLPMSFSVGPNIGPTFLVIGDASGSINPFNGEGIAYAYETGRFAATSVSEALQTDNGLALQGYRTRIEEEYALYYKVARLFVRVIGQPVMMHALVRTGMANRTLWDWIVRIMSNSLRPDEMGGAEAAYKAIASIVRLSPSR